MPSPVEPPAITLDSVVVATRNQVSSDLAGEVILLSLQTAQYYGAAGVAARIWELVRDPIRVATLRDVVLDEYEVEPEVCQRDLLAFLDRLATEGLLSVRDGRPDD